MASKARSAGGAEASADQREGTMEARRGETPRCLDAQHDSAIPERETPYLVQSSAIYSLQRS